MSAAGSGLFVSDIDGTLVTPDKRLTRTALDAVAELRAAGVPYTVVSSRPPRGMRHIVDALDVKLPFAAFNGGNIVDPAKGVIAAHRLAEPIVRRVLELIADHGVAPWVFADDAWFVTDPAGALVALERMTVSFEPTVVADFDAVIERIDKIVAPTDDTPRLDRIEAALRGKLGAEANIERSQSYYVDVTHPLANKGEAVRALAVYADASLARTVVIGDMTNDIAMFRVAGFSIAMGQAPEPVKSAADALTGPDTADGFAQAVRTLVLPRLAPATAEQAK